MGKRTSFEGSFVVFEIFKDFVNELLREHKIVLTCGKGSFSRLLVASLE